MKERRYFQISIIPAVVFWFLIKYRALDRFVVGAFHGLVGFDFFSVPRSSLNLLAGKSIFNTAASSYGPYASWYPYHPVLSALVGSWTSLFSPWTAYFLFVTISLISLVALGAVMRFSLGKCPGADWVAWFLICSPATYLMLWNGQMQVLATLGLGLVLTGIFGSWRRTIVAQHSGILVFAGSLLSFFSKPMIILFIPGILLSKTVRFYFLAAVLVYAVISILYISMPNLNPEGNRRYSLESFSCGGSGYVNGKSVDNLVHWVNIICQSKILEVNDKEVYSLPNFLGEIFGGEFPLWVTRLPLFLTALFAFLGFYFFRQPSALERDEMAFYICILGLLCHYLSYNRVWEYQFSTLQIVSPFLLCTFYLEKKGIGKGLIGFAFLMTLTFFLPTLYFHTSTPAFGELWKIRFIRSLPPAVIFFTLGGLVIVRFFKISKSPLTVS